MERYPDQIRGEAIKATEHGKSSGQQVGSGKSKDWKTAVSMQAVLGIVPLILLPFLVLHAFGTHNTQCESILGVKASNPSTSQINMKISFLLLITLLAALAATLALKTTQPLTPTTIPQAVANNPDFTKVEHAAAKSSGKLPGKKHKSSKGKKTCLIVVAIVLGLAAVVVVVVMLILLKRAGFF
ncbi:hypothetical protein VTL71DRAFT_2946 [Oculimacula yallundae]|uniref:Uncharacterized protein n=1 Tax=Oculimacula yallundae TaxID=86028 RepID=A0ABR4C6K6_9HELO